MEKKCYLCGKMNIDIDNRWAQLLGSEMQKEYFQKLWQFVETEYAQGVCYPPQGKIFAAFNECGPDDVRAVILGQDPYHEEGQAEGLCFSFSEGLAGAAEPLDLFGNALSVSNSCNPKKWPPSLKNIIKEVSADTGAAMPENGSLLRWARQGVLLLNATLTVRQGQANSHAGRGWEQFTDAVIKLVSQHCEHVVFFLWGSYAQKKAILIDPARHLVLQSAHPSPLSAHRGFFGNHQFSSANDYLRSHGRSEIVW